MDEDSKKAIRFMVIKAAIFILLPAAVSVVAVLVLL
ncbi:phosphoribosylformylglycinamidine synthase-associated small membrane protein [Roseibium sp.]